MANIKLSFTELKKSLPPYVLWLLLAAAFLIVVILLFLLFSGNDTPAAPAPAAPAYTINASPTDVKIMDITAGESASAQVKVGATGPMKITNIAFDKNVAGLSQTNTCMNAGANGLISDKLSCDIFIKWAPTAATNATAVINIKYAQSGEPDNMANTLPVAVSVSSKDKPKEVPVAVTVAAPKPKEVPVPKKVPVAVPVTEPTPAPTPAPDPAPAPAPVPAPAPIMDLARVPSINDVPVAPQTDTVSESAPTDPCYEFAFAGYNLSGVQSGWIRAENGHYMYHPFSDTHCKAATGTYNSDTGLIYDLKDSSKTIGSDAQHIGGGGIAANVKMPTLSNPTGATAFVPNWSVQTGIVANTNAANPGHLNVPKPASDNRIPSSVAGNAAIASSQPYDRTYVLRQYKPIPATIVSDVRADTTSTRLPVMATVDRNVYSDDGRTVILPTGTQMLGYVTGEMPGPYKTIGRLQINWYRFIRPDNVEFNFAQNQNPFSADSQGRTGVPGRGETDYLQQMVMPMLTAVVPAAINLIAPISDKFINQIDLDNNTVTQSGQVRSSELAKQDVISTWNKVVQKLALDMMSNMAQPFTISAGTRITVFSPIDLIVNFCDPGDTDCTGIITAAPYQDMPAQTGAMPSQQPEEYIGQVASYNTTQYCQQDANGVWQVDPSLMANPTKMAELLSQGIDMQTLQLTCQQNNYQAKSVAQYNAYYQQQQQNAKATTPEQYNTNVLGLTTDANGQIVNPFAETPPANNPATATAAAPAQILCPDTQTPPDPTTGCCPGETLTDMGDAGNNCCPATGGDCFPPII